MLWYIQWDIQQGRGIHRHVDILRMIWWCAWLKTWLRGGYFQINWSTVSCHIMTWSDSLAAGFLPNPVLLPIIHIFVPKQKKNVFLVHTTEMDNQKTPMHHSRPAFQGNKSRDIMCARLCRFDIQLGTGAIGEPGLLSYNGLQMTNIHCPACTRYPHPKWIRQLPVGI